MKGDFKLKKVVISIILVFLILIISFNSCFAAITVTEESLESSINKLLENQSTSNEQTVAIDLNKTQKQINVTADNVQAIINYDLSSKPTFSIDISFRNTMTQSEWEIEGEKQTLLAIPFALVADHANIEYMNSMYYILSKISESSSTVIVSTPTNAIEYAKSMYENVNQTITDDLFTWTNEKISETDTEYNIKSTLIINTDADFSVMNSAGDEYNAILDAAQNAVNEYENAVEEENETLQEAQNHLDSIISSTNSTNVTNSNTINDLPQTGNSIFILAILIFSSCICSIFAIKFIKYKDID